LLTQCQTFGTISLWESDRPHHIKLGMYWISAPGSASGQVRLRPDLENWNPVHPYIKPLKGALEGTYSVYPTSRNPSRNCLCLRFRSAYVLHLNTLWTRHARVAARSADWAVLPVQCAVRSVLLALSAAERTRLISDRPSAPRQDFWTDPSQN